MTLLSFGNVDQNFADFLCLCFVLLHTRLSRSKMAIVTRAQQRVTFIDSSVTHIHVSTLGQPFAYHCTCVRLPGAKADLRAAPGDSHRSKQRNLGGLLRHPHPCLPRQSPKWEFILDLCPLWHRRRKWVLLRCPTT